MTGPRSNSRTVNSAELPRYRALRWTMTGTLVIAAADDICVDALVPRRRDVWSRRWPNCGADPSRSSNSRRPADAEFTTPHGWVWPGHLRPEVSRLLRDLLFLSDNADPSTSRGRARRLTDAAAPRHSAGHRPGSRGACRPTITLSCLLAIAWVARLLQNLVLVLERECHPLLVGRRLPSPFPPPSNAGRRADRQMETRVSADSASDDEDYEATQVRLRRS